MGDKVLCQFGGRRRPYPATISAVNSTVDAGGQTVARYDVIYNDGDMDTDVPEAWLKARQEKVTLGVPSLTLA